MIASVVLATVALAIGLWLLMKRAEDAQERHSLETEKLLASSRALRERIAADMENGPAQLQPTPQEKRLAIADRSWAQFDAFQDSRFRTKEMLGALRMQADQVGQGLPSVEAQEISEHNAEQFRQRLPSVLIAGESGLVSGEGNRTIIPSAEPGRCLELAKAWAVGEFAQALARAGYTQIECDDEAKPVRTWKL